MACHPARRGTSALATRFVWLRLALAAALWLAAGSGVVRAGSATWNVAGGGAQNWNAAANWTPNTTFPDAIDDVATCSTVNLTANATISLNQDTTIGTLTFGDTTAAQTYTITPGTGGRLTFDVSAGSAGLHRTSAGTGIDTISAHIMLNDNLDITNTTTGGITLSGNIEDDGGGRGIAKLGNGTGVLLLNGYNTFGGGVTLAGGYLTLGSASALGTGTLTISNGVTLNSSVPNLVLADNNPIVLNARFTNTGTYNMDLGAGDVTLNATCVISNTTVNNTLTIGGAITGNTFGITKLGAGTLALTGTNSTYSGKTRISAGTLRVASLENVGNASSLGAPTTIANGTIDLGSNALAGTLRYTGEGDTSDRVINLAGTTGGGIIQNDGSGALIFTNDFTATGAGGKILTLQGTNTAESIIYGNITNSSGGATSLTKAGIGTWVLAGGNAIGSNTFTGTTAINGGGTLVLDYSTKTNSKLANASALTLGGTAFGGTLTLRGGSHTEIVSATTLSAGSFRVTQPSGTSILRMNAITRAAGGTIDFGAPSIAQTDNLATNNSLLGGWATVAGTNWATNSTAAADGPITAYTNYTAFPAAVGSAFTNYLLTGPTNLTGNVLVNTLKIANSANSQTLTMGAFNLTSTWASATRLGGLLYVGGFDNLYTISGSGRIGATNEFIVNVYTGRLTIAAPIIGAGAGSLTKTGSGKLILTVANTFTGSMRINQGVVSLSNATASGTTAGGITVAPGAALELQGAITVGAEALNPLTGTGVTNSGALRNISGNNTYGGAITLGVDGARINSDSGTLIRSGTLATAALRDLTIGGAGIVTNTGVISGAGNIIKDGSGTLVLNSANTFTGTTRINGGTVRVGNATGLGNASYATVIFGDASNAKLQLTNATTIIGLSGDSFTTVENGGPTARILTINNANDCTFAGLIQNGSSGSLGLTKPATAPGMLILSGTNNSYTGITTLNGGLLVVASLANGGANCSIGAAASNAANLVLGDGNLRYTGPTVAINRSFTLTAAAVSVLNITDSNTTLTISGGSAANAGNLTKRGPGTLVLSGANAHTGMTKVREGTLAYGANNALATGPVAVSGTNAVLDMGSYTDSVGQVTLTAGSITGTGGSRLTSTAGFTMDGAGATLISANLAGAVGLTNSGSGVLTLSGTNNTYSGTTRISSGTLRVNGSLRGGGQVIVTNSGTLGGTGTVAGAVFIYTNSTLAPGSNAVGILTVTNGVTFTGGTFRVNVTTTNSGDYGQVRVAGGNVIITNATLDVNGTGGYTPGDYDYLWIINNTSAAGTVSGAFTNLAEGGETNISGKMFTMYYRANFATGGTSGGNDVLLARIFPGTLYFVGGGNWNAAASWATNSGGTPGIGVPNANVAVIFDANSGNCTLNTNGACRSLTTTAGYAAYTLALGTNDLSVVSNLVHAGGIITIGASASVGLNVNGSITNSAQITCSGASRINCAGDWYGLNGTNTASTSRVTLDGANAQMITTGGAWNPANSNNNWKNNWNWLDVQNTSTVTFADGFKAAQFTCTQTVAALLYFASQNGATNVFEITASNGLQIWGGAALANRVQLRRYGGSGSDRWEIYPSFTNGAAPWIVSNVDVAYSVNSASNAILPANSTDSGSNINWFTATFVSLGWFAAIGRDNSVTVRWKTETEVNTAGFNLYRSTSEAGPYTRVNDSFIRGLGTSSRGREYKYADANVVNGITYYYKLESVEFNGRSTWHGPVAAHPGLDSDGDGMTDDWENFYGLNPLVNDANEDPDGDGLTNYQEFLADTNPNINEGADGGGWGGGPPVAPDGNAGIYKLEVKADGLYRITADYLTTNAGVTNLGDWNITNISVYNQGSEIPLRVYREGAAGFGANDYFEFYGTGMNTRFTDANIYWLYPGATNTTGTNAGLRMPEISGAGGWAIQTSAWHMAHYEQNEYYRDDLPDEAPDDDHWFFANYLFATTNASSTNVLNPVLANVAAEDVGAVVRVALRGVMDYLDPPHHVLVTLNGVGLTNVADNGHWQGNGEYIFSAGTSQTNLVEGTNVLQVILPGDTGAAYELVLINWVEIDYLRALQAESNSLIFSAASAGVSEYQMAGYTTNDVQVFRVVNATNVSVITDLSIAGEESGPWTVTFADTLAVEEAGATYAAVGSGARKIPAAVTEDAASDLRSTLNGADYIIIAHDTLTNAVQPLADFRAAQGLRVKTVSVQDVYDDFNFGIISPYAIRDFMTYARANWTPPAPVYLLLVGDATYDYRDYEGGGLVNYVPAKLVHDSESLETPSDNWYVALDGNDDYLPDMYVGRLPARTNDVTTLINKILSYETNAPPDDWARKVMLVAGDEPQFVDINELVGSYLPTNYLSNKIYLSDYGSAALCKTAITNGINAGALITHYAGHGSIQLWASIQTNWPPSERTIFQTTDIPSLTNGVGLPFFITPTCLNGYFIYPQFESLAEELIRKATGGAVACFSPSGFSTSPHQQQIVDGLFDSIFNEGAFTLGPAVTRAKQKAYDAIGDNSWNVVQIFTLFGDPAMRLKEWTGYTNADVMAPQVDLTSPLDGAENVADMAQIRITFNEAMDDVMTRAAFSISPAVVGAFAWEGYTLVFQPEDIYTLATVYTVTIKSNACDLAGNRLAADYRFSFARTYPAGTLAIDVTPAAGSWQLVSTPVTYHGTTNGTGDLPASEAPEGSYGVIYNALAGYTAPAAQTQTVHRGVLTTFSGVYNQRPVITEGTILAAPYDEGDLAQGISFTLHAADAEADTLTWSIKTSATNGTASASGTGNEKVVSYQPQANSRGADAFVVKVTDTAGGEDEITVNVSFNNPPQFAALANQSVELGGLLTFDVSATDPDGTAPALSMPVYPAGAAFTDHGQGAGTFNWTPDKVTDLGDHSVRFVASDGQLSDIKDITIHVTTFTVTSPKENGVTRRGGNLNVAWSGQRLLGAVAVDLWQGTNFILNLTNNLPAPANQMTWQTTMPFSIRPGRDYRISVMEANNANNWANSGPFAILVQCPNDFDGDGMSDLTLYDSTAGNWSVYGSLTGFYRMQFDDAGVSPVPWDYDGDGKTDFVVYQEATGNWHMRMRISDSRYLADTARLGGPGYGSVAGDYDGDGKMDIAVYQETSGRWYLLLSSGGYSPDSGLTGIFGGPGCRSVSGDYDGDGKTDPVLYQSASGGWYGLLSDMGYALISVNLGGPEYQPVSGDFDGDGRSDIAVYQETTGIWYVMLPARHSLGDGGSDSNYALYSLKIGGPGYTPVPGDYDGDGKTDFVVYQEVTGNWYGRLSGNGYATGSTTFGGRPCRAIVP